MKWLGAVEVMRLISLNSGVSLSIHLRFAPTEISVRRVPQSKPSGFGSKIQQVCKYACLIFFLKLLFHSNNFRREERSIPFLITSCVREVERRGMQEVGIYRVSGSSSDLSKLKKSFETSKFLSPFFNPFVLKRFSRLLRSWTITQRRLCPFSNWDFETVPERTPRSAFYRLTLRKSKLNLTLKNS